MRINWIVALALACVMSTGCRGESMDKLKQGGVVMIEFKNHLRTLCFGRVLIDVPEESLIDKSWETFVPPVGRFYVDARNITEDEFRQRMALIETGLQNKENNAHTPLFISAVTPQEDPLARIIVQRTEQGSFGKTLAEESSVYVLTYRLIGGNLFHIKQEIYAEYSSARHDFLPFSQSKLDQSLRDGYALLARIQPLADGQIPTQPGYCVDHGFIPDFNESVSTGMSFRLKEYPGFWFSMEDSDGRVDSAEATSAEAPSPAEQSQAADRLPARMKNLESAMGLVKLTVDIKKLVPLGPKTIGPYAGQTMLWRNSLPDHARDLFGEWEYPGSPSNPYLHIQFDDSSVNPETGQRYAKEMPEQDVTALWFRMLESLRPRPNAR